MRPLAFALLLTGCATTGPTGPAPKVASPRAVSLALDVAGSDRAEFDSYVQWILKDNGLLRRVSSGGDLHVTVDANLDCGVSLLAGTDLKLVVRVHGDGLDESRTWARAGLTSGVPNERDRMTTEAVVWALGRAANAAAGGATPVQAAPPAPSHIELPTSEPSDAPPPPPTHKKKRRR